MQVFTPLIALFQMRTKGSFGSFGALDNNAYGLITMPKPPKAERVTLIVNTPNGPENLYVKMDSPLSFALVDVLKELQSKATPNMVKLVTSIKDPFDGRVDLRLRKPRCAKPPKMTASDVVILTSMINEERDVRQPMNWSPRQWTSTPRPLSMTFADKLVPTSTTKLFLKKKWAEIDSELVNIAKADSWQIACKYLGLVSWPL
jgi:hypothetical protein